MTAHNHPTILVLFGATGDLASRKLLPALFDLYRAQSLPERFLIIAAARREQSVVEYQESVRELLAAPTRDPAHVRDFVTHVTYVSGDFIEAATYKRIHHAIHQYNETIGQCSNVLYYLAVPPAVYGTMFTMLAKSNSLDICRPEDNAWARLLVEKPFGKDLATAQALEQQLCEAFADEQVYRIDHYLAKTAIENILSLRFGNSLLGSTWSGQYIDQIDIELYEDIDVADRGGFYDGIGALRDVGQNHLLQIIAYLLTEVFDSSDAHATRAARAQVLASLQVATDRPLVRGQYAGYREHERVATESETETFFCFTLESQLPAWQGVPITVAAGKALQETRQSITVTFRPVELAETGFVCAGDTHTNVLTITLAPRETITLRLATRQNGHDRTLESHDYTLVNDTVRESGPDAYELVLLDCIRGEQNRFLSGAEVVAAWSLITPLLADLQQTPLHHYAPGSDPATIGLS